MLCICKRSRSAVIHREWPGRYAKAFALGAFLSPGIRFFKPGFKTCWDGASEADARAVSGPSAAQPSLARGGLGRGCRPCLPRSPELRPKRSGGLAQPLVARATSLHATDQAASRSLAVPAPGQTPRLPLPTARGQEHRCHLDITGLAGRFFHALST